MGIKGLSTFMSSCFDGWKPAKLDEWDRIVIDGNCICTEMYRMEHLTTDYGGEYREFGATVEDFFVKAKLNNPLVLLDGTVTAEIDHDLDKIIQKKNAGFESLKKDQEKPKWHSRKKNKYTWNTKPTMTISVFMDVLQKLGIAFHVVQGEANRVIAAIANRLECPVLTSDSDFFMFDLKSGLIHFTRYREDNPSFYQLTEFRKQFSISLEQRLAIPAVFIDSYEPKVIIKRYRELLDKLSTDKQCHEVTENDVEIMKYCNLERSLPLNFDPGNPVVNSCQSSVLKIFPEWVATNFEKGSFPPQLIGASLNGIYLLPKLVEVIDMNSAWKISRYIRQFLYGFMGITTEVREGIREDHCPQLIMEPVSPKTSLLCKVSIRDTSQLEDNINFVLMVLKCVQIPQEKLDTVFYAMEDKWKLPVAATFYWYHHIQGFLQDQERVILLESLLLSFLTCSGHIAERDIPPLREVTSDTKAAHSTALHAFAQWQCVYHDARYLNYVAREPFPTTSPAHLYSGHVAMYYATNVSHKDDWSAKIIPRDSEEWKMYTNMLDIITA